MTIFILFLIIGLLLFTVALTWREGYRQGASLGEQVSSTFGKLTGQSAKKQKRLDRIIALLEPDKELTNADIRNSLGVSSRTVVRYMDELEKTGKVKQVGKTGVHTTYRLK